MDKIVIVIHLLVVVALVGLILVQRSEGGGLGIGGGGGGFMSARGASNALTRTTAILAVIFFATSLVLSLLARYQPQPTDIFDRLPQAETERDGGGAGILDELGGPLSAPSPAQEEPVAPTGESSVPAPAESGSTPAEDSQPQVPTGQ
ncbi:preprotein translocase subunit SecG [Chelativorans sp. Marseille-P2723]|uniref:preprotein translocase subunit SecG n=1 Tax=Chelativorans sp. Marseille-P2723 TaxID=2709133 RepID=UPI00156EC182|nr:preprotein translocase subunit SecG [Chelativorans sp. Marseille-P2723]